MDKAKLKKFFEPTWRKAKIFAILYILFVIGRMLLWNNAIVAYGNLTDYELYSAATITVLFDSLTIPFSVLFDFYTHSSLDTANYFLLNPEYLVSPLNAIITTLIKFLNLLWIYFIASLIDSRVKK